MPRHWRRRMTLLINWSCRQLFLNDYALTTTGLDCLSSLLVTVESKSEAVRIQESLLQGLATSCLSHIPPKFDRSPTSIRTPVMSYLPLSIRLWSSQSLLAASRFGAYRAVWRSSVSRVNWSHKSDSSSFDLRPNQIGLSKSTHSFYRSYATRPGKAESRPGRTAATKRRPAVVEDDAVANTPRKAASKKKPSAKKRSARKKKRTTKTQRKTGTKKARVSRKALTDKQKALKARKDVAKKRRELQEKALLDGPKGFPCTPWTLLIQEMKIPGKRMVEVTPEVSARYKNLAPAELEVRSRSIGDW